jgi:hypothetical protein
MPRPIGQPPLRRSSRVNVGVAVRISGTLPGNRPFSEESSVLTISKYGAKIKTQVPLSLGMQVHVQALRSRKTGLFRVVWIGRAGTPRAGEVGLEYVGEHANVFGITFPE